MTIDSEYLNCEGYLVGAILCDADVVRRVRSEVAPADFKNNPLRTLYSAALTLSDEGAVIDPISLSERAKIMGER